MEAGDFGVLGPVFVRRAKIATSSQSTEPELATILNPSSWVLHAQEWLKENITAQMVRFV